MALVSLELLFWIGMKKLIFHCTKHNFTGVGVAGEEEDRVVNMYSRTDDERIWERQTYRVDGIDTLPALIPFSLHPPSVQIGEQSVDITGSLRVPIPLHGVVQ